MILLKIMKKPSVKLLIYIIFFIMINISVSASDNDEVKISVNGQLLQSNPPIRFENGIILAPISIINEITDKIGADKRWNENTSNITVNYKNIVVGCAVGNPYIIVENRNTGTTETFELPDAAIPKIYNRIPFFPVEHIYMRMGLIIQWDRTNRILQITTPYTGTTSTSTSTSTTPTIPRNSSTLGVSIGTSFAAPLFIGTAYGTYAPFKSSFFKDTFLEFGMDLGLGIYRPDIQYFSLYPFVNYALFTPFPRR